MEKKAFFRLSLAAVALGAGIFAAAAPGSAAETQLIWSTTSPVANESTRALAEGRHVHAIRFAKDVLRSKTHPTNHVIARHNLCLAYLARGEREDAAPFCELARNAEARYQVAERDGRLVVTTETSDAGSASTLEAAIRTNVANAQGTALAENQ